MGTGQQIPRRTLIAIAGAIGSGKSTIAAAVSQRLNIPMHSIDDDKLKMGASEPEFERWVAEGIPFPDTFRQQVFNHTLEQLADLAADNPQVIVEEAFHRAALRDPFFRSGKELFGHLVLIEVVVSPEIAIAHLQKRAQDESDHMAGQDMFDAFAKLADPLTGQDLIVENNGVLEDPVDQICAFITTIS